MPVEINCNECGQPFNVVPARKETAKFCSYKCAGKWRSKHFNGSGNPNYKPGAERVKKCENCGNKFRQGDKNLAVFSQRKFCSVKCQFEGQYRPSGEDHPNWQGGSSRKRRSKHAAWARNVISRDNATCQKCGATEVELHAHHVKSYAQHPELQYDMTNGITLCFRCHWEEHSVPTANAVNSGDPLTGGAEGNPEPSSERKLIEGVTTRGRAYRRWNGNCDWCGKFISKRWSDTKGKKHLFCSRSCAAYHNSNTREYCRPAVPRQRPGQ